MVIEWLHYRVPLAQQPAFLQADAAVWTAALSPRPGYLGKQVWRDSADPDSLSLIIRWHSRAEWKAVPADLLEDTERRFREAFAGEAEFLGCTDLDVVID